MKKMLAFALSAVMALSLVACGNNGKTGGTSPEIPDPFTECETMDEAAKLAGFDLCAPDAVDGQEKTAIRVLTEGGLVEVIYGGEDEQVVIRKGEGSEDISGDYNEYSTTETATVDGVEVTLKGDGDKVNLSTFASNGYTYAISSSTGMTKVAMTDLAKAICGNETMTIGGDPSTWGPVLNDGGIEIPAPFTEYASMDEAAANAGFDMKVPESVDGYSQRMIQVFDAADEPMFEVIYRSGEDENANTIHIRKAAGSEDISGDYTEYAESNTVAVGEIQVTMQGENGQVRLATWTNNGYTYSIGVYAEAGVSSDMMAGLVAAVQ